MDIKLVLLRFIAMWVMLTPGALLCDVDPIIFHLFRFVLVKGGDLPDSSDSIDVYFDGMITHWSFPYFDSYICLCL